MKSFLPSLLYASSSGDGKAGLVHEQYFLYNQILQGKSMTETGMDSIMRKRIAFVQAPPKTGDGTLSTNEVSETFQSTNKDVMKWQIINTQPATICFPSSVSW